MSLLEVRDLHVWFDLPSSGSKQADQVHAAAGVSFALDEGERFGLVGDQVYQMVGELSGGERSRAALARLVALGINVLVLDEPTNHLDLWARDALEQALLEFDGTAIVAAARTLRQL